MMMASPSAASGTSACQKPKRPGSRRARPPRSSATPMQMTSPLETSLTQAIFSCAFSYWNALVIPAYRNIAANTTCTIHNTTFIGFLSAPFSYDLRTGCSRRRKLQPVGAHYKEKTAISQAGRLLAGILCRILRWRHAELPAWKVQLSSEVGDGDAAQEVDGLLLGLAEDFAEDPVEALSAASAFVAAHGPLCAGSRHAPQHRVHFAQGDPLRRLRQGVPAHPALAGFDDAGLHQRRQHPAKEGGVASHLRSDLIAGADVAGLGEPNQDMNRHVKSARGEPERPRARNHPVTPP